MTKWTYRTPLPSLLEAATPGTWAVISHTFRSWRAGASNYLWLGQYIDVSIHEACALTTEAAIANYVYRARCCAVKPAAITRLA